MRGSTKYPRHQFYLQRRAVLGRDPQPVEVLQPALLPLHRQEALAALRRQATDAEHRAAVVGVVPGAGSGAENLEFSMVFLFW